MNMSERGRNKKRNHRTAFAWRWLALALSVLLLIGGIGTLAFADEEEGGGEEGGGEPPKVKITWRLNYGDETIVGPIDTQVTAGTPVSESDAPSEIKAGKKNKQYTYTFSGWATSFGTVNEPTTFIATCERTTNQYSVKFVDDDGTDLLEARSYDYGTPADGIEKPSTPPDKEDDNYTYTFSGWSPSIAEVTEDVTYKATYERHEKPTVQSFKVTFVDDDGTELYSADFEEGQTPTYGGETPTKDPDGEFTYEFTGWTPEITTVTGAATYTAVYSKTPIEKPKFKVTFQNWDGTVLSEKEYEEGTSKDALEVPTATRQDDAQYTYAFAAWDPALEDVSREITYKATFTSTLRKYKVTFVDEDGTTVLLAAADYDYGTKADKIVQPETPKKPSDGDYVYTFKEWKPALAEVTKDVTYKATYDKTSLTVTAAPYTYKLSEDGKEATITKYTGTDAELIVPATFGDAAVVAIASGVFRDKDKLTKLEIPAGVKRIGENAFADCDKLESLTLPDSLEAELNPNIIANDPKLATLTLRSVLETTLNPTNTITHSAVVDGQTKTYTVVLPMAVTDILVTKNNVQENPASLTVDCDMEIATGHSILVEAGATLTNKKTIKNFGTITNSGTFTNSGAVYSCAGTISGVSGGTLRTTGQHTYVSGRCSICDEKLPKLTVSYTGGELTKEYDKLYNTSISKSHFRIDDTHGLDLSISKVSSARYSQKDVGRCSVKVYLDLAGSDAGLYGSKVSLTLPATITPRTLTITPRPDQKKIYGTADPNHFSGTVRGLLAERVDGRLVNDKITGKLGREEGKNAGKYRITQGTLDAGANYKIVVAEQYFTIEPKDINKSDVTLASIAHQRYTGQKVEPDITMRYGREELRLNTDYKVEYTDNIQPGMAKVKMTGIGNYTGTRESSFRILNIASGVEGPGGGGGGGFSGGSSSSGGYSDGSFGEGEGPEGEGPEGEEGVGKLILQGNDYGTILFDAAGRPAPFTQLEEKIETEAGSKIAPWRLVIIADPLMDEETGEPLMLDGSDREQYDELHLRLTPMLMDTLANLGCQGIVYEVDSAEVHIPMDALKAEIMLDERIRPDVIGTIEAEEGEPEEGEDAEEDVEELEMELTPETIQVQAYDICLLQSETTPTTDRETEALSAYDALTPSYRLRVRAVTGTEDAVPLSEGEVASLPFAERLPEGGYPAGLIMRTMTLETLEGTPVNAVAVFISEMETETDTDLVTAEPAEFANKDGALYAIQPVKGDGLYLAGTPAGTPVELSDELPAEEETETIEEETESIEEEDADFEEGFGTGTAGPLSSMGSSFSLDEDGNPVFD